MAQDNPDTYHGGGGTAVDGPSTSVMSPKLGPDTMLDTTGASGYTGLSRKTLERLRWQGGSPVFYKIGALVRYKVSDLDVWIESRRRVSTSDPGPAVSTTMQEVVR